MKADKRKKLPRCFWFRQAAIYPPALVLFFALFGLIYLLNSNMLLTVYAIPFLLVFLLGAVWLKTVKRYILKQQENKNNG
jgi:ABC-type bacteriocin/lantibiotic exporter with double-glycine peptidase domain